MATYTGTSGTDIFDGTAGSDIFNFAVADLAASDWIAGNGGTDVLRFTTAGVVSAAKLSSISGIEAITLAVAGPTVIIDDVFASKNGPVLQINDATGHANIASADLIRYSAGTIDDATAASYFSTNGSVPQSGYGAFLVGENAGGDIVLYHYTNVGGIHTDLIATFENISLNEIQLSDFSFV
jgi:hypothetical protein